MPGGSKYPGPAEDLAQYSAVVDASDADALVKGAKNPYTSRNGHMFSFLLPDGGLALRLDDRDAEEFIVSHASGPVEQHGRTMRGYVSVPADLLDDTAQMVTWFDRSYDWIGTLPPK